VVKNGTVKTRFRPCLMAETTSFSAKVVAKKSRHMGCANFLAYKGRPPVRGSVFSPLFSRGTPNAGLKSGRPRSNRGRLVLMLGIRHGIWSNVVNWSIYIRRLGIRGTSSQAVPLLVRARACA
jgi:hypothetical protein